MGALCCCPSQGDFEEYIAYPNGCVYQHCICLKCCVRWLLRMDIMKKILKYQHSVDTIFILAVFMNGWKEAKTVQSVTRFWCDDHETKHPFKKNVYTLGCGSVDDGRVAMGSKAKSAVGKNLRVSSDLKKVILKQKSELPDGFKKTLHGLKGNSLENNLLWGDTAEDELFIPLDSSTKERSLDWSQDDSTEVTHSVEAIQPCTDILSCAVVVAPNEEWKVQVTSQVTPAALSPPCIQGFQQNGVEKGFFKDERRSSFKNAPCYTPKVVPIPQVMDSQIGNELDPFRDMGHIFYIAPPLDNIPVVLPPANSMHGSVQGLLVSFHQGMSANFDG